MFFSLINKGISRILNTKCLRGLPYVVMVIGILLTGYFYYQSNRYAQHVVSASFNYEAMKVNDAVTVHLKAYHQVLLGAQGLLRVSPDIQRRAFSEYVETLNLKKTFPGIHGVGFSLLIPKSGLSSHIATVRSQGYPSYTVRPSGFRDPYSSIIYLEPFSGRNLRAFGYDMFSEPNRQMAMQLACDENEAVLSSKVKLVQETASDVQSGFLIFLPVYRQGASPRSINERRNALRGWVYAPFRMNDFVSGFAERPSSDIRIRIYDGASQKSGDLMYDSEKVSKDARPIYVKSTQIKTFHHTWTVVVESLPSFGNRSANANMLMMAVLGILASLLLSFVSYRLVHSSESLERAIVVRTAELQEKQDILTEGKKLAEYALDGSDVGVWDLHILTGEFRVNARFAEILGYKLDEFPISHISYLYRFAHPDDVHNVETSIHAHIEGKLPFFKSGARMRHADGRWVWIRINGKVSERDADGKPVRMTGTHIDNTEPYERQRDMKKQEAVLNGTASALENLLTDTDLHAAINEALALLGTSVGVDRTYIFQNHVSDETGEMLSSQRYEWCTDRTRAQIDNPELQGVPYSMIPRWLAAFESSQCIQGPVWTFPKEERPILEEQSILSLVAAPIHIDGQLWGFIGFDDCHHERVWTTSEVSILSLAASGVGGAIKRHALSIEVEEGRQWLQTMKDSLATGIVVVDKRTCAIVDANPAFLRTVGLVNDQVVGISFNRFVRLGYQPCVDPTNDSAVDDNDIQGRCDPRCQLSGTDELTVSDDVTMRRSDGTLLPVIVSSVKMVIGGRQYIIHGMIDISALKAAEEQLRESMALLNGLFESMSDMVYFKDIDGHYRTYNKAFKQTFTPERDAIGLTAYELYDKELADELTETDQEVTVNRKTVTFERSTTQSDGSTIIIETRKSPLVTEDGQCIGIVGVARNVTAQRNLERMHEELVQFIVHDMRSPLTAILGGIDMLKDESCSTEDRDNYMSMSEASAQELITMVSSLLDIYKLDDDKMVLHRTTRNLLGVTGAAVASVSVIALQHCVTISVSGDDVDVSVDEELIQRVIVNLLVNAVKHNVANGHVEATVIRQTDTARVSITDNGPGIPEDHREAVFDRFTQVELRNQRKKYSTGLGLTYCRMAVELHGGQIGVDSELGKGSTFWFELPLNASS